MSLFGAVLTKLGFYEPLAEFHYSVCSLYSSLRDFRNWGPSTRKYLVSPQEPYLTIDSQEGSQKASKENV